MHLMQLTVSLIVMFLMVTVAQRFKFATLTFLEICIYLMFDFCLLYLRRSQ